MFTASVKNNGDPKYYAATRDYTFDISTEGQGAHPIDTVLAGLCGCVGHFVKDYMHREAIPYEELRLKAEAESAENPNRLSEISLQIGIIGAPVIIRQHEEKLLKFIQNCPVYGTLSAGSAIRCSLVGDGDTSQ